MAAISLENLDHRRVAIELYTGEQFVRFSGTASYDRCADSGSVLKIHVPDPAGDFDLMLAEGRWSGEIHEDHRWGCDYRIVLTVAELSRRP